MLTPNTTDLPTAGRQALHRTDPPAHLDPPARHRVSADPTRSLARAVLDRHGFLSSSDPGAGRASYRTVWISDIHLGSRNSKAEMLLDFLGAMRCERLYLVGDIIDEWKLRKTPYWPRAHAAVLERFRELGRAGTDVVYVPGNHDASLREGQPLELDHMRLELEPIHHTADGRKLLVSHGDRFDPYSSGSSLLVRAGDLAYELVLALNNAYNGVARLFGARYRSLSLTLKQLVKEAVKAIDNFEQGVVTEARRLGVDGIVCGHIHKAELREVEGLVYANDGDWVESCTALVEHACGRLELVQWRGGHIQALEAGRATSVPDPLADREPALLAG